MGWRCSPTPHLAPLALVSLIRFVRISASHFAPYHHLLPRHTTSSSLPRHTPASGSIKPTHTSITRRGRTRRTRTGRRRRSTAKTRSPPLSPASAPSRRLFSFFFTSSPPPPRHASYPSRVPPRAPRPSRAVRPSSSSPTSPALQAASATQTSTLEVLCAQPASYCIARVACPSHRDGLPPHPAVRHLFLFTQSHAPLCHLPPTTTTLVCHPV